MTDPARGAAGPTGGGETAQDGPELKPVLGLFDATMIVMGCVVGAGIFRTPREVAAVMGSSGGVLAAWVLGGFLALCGALVFAELGATLPRTGGQYAFLRHGLGRFTAFLCGWSLLATINSGAIGFIGLIFVDHMEALIRYVGGDADFALGTGLRRGIAVAMIAGLTWLNVRGLRLGATVQNVAMAAKVLGIVSVVVFGLVHLIGGDGPVPPPPAAPDEPASGLPPSFLLAMATALLPAAFSYGGFQNLSAPAAEIKNPQRTIPRATLIGTGLIIALYVSVNWALLSILGVEGVARSATPVAAAAGAVWKHGEAFIAALVMISTFGIMQVLLMVMPRVFYAMAKDGAFLPVAARIHPVHGTPAAAILLLGGFSLVHVFFGSHLELLQMAVLVDWLFFGLCGVVFFRMRVREPDRPRPYRALGYPVLPAVFVLFAAIIVVNSLLNAEKLAVYRALGLMGVGVLLYALLPRRASAPSNEQS